GVGIVALGACAGVQAGTLAGVGVGRGGLVRERRAIVDAAARGHLDFVFLRRFAVRIMPALGVPLIRDSFDYLHDDGTLSEAFRLPAVYGEASVGIGVKLP